MKETQKKIGDMIITKKVKEPIPKGCIHIYPEKKVGIAISRKFIEQLKVLGVKRWKRTPEMKYDHPDLDAYVRIVDNSLYVSLYLDEMPEMKTMLHNFMLVGFEKSFEDEIRERFPATTRARVDNNNIMFLPTVRDPRVLHMKFDLDKAEIVGRVQTDVRDFFV